MKRIEVYFSGRVQGVGFRFTTLDLAKELGILGWVKNLADGRVQLVAEGKEEDLNKLLSRLEEYFFGYIKDKKINWLKPTGEFRNFEIRF